MIRLLCYFPGFVNLITAIVKLVIVLNNKSHIQNKHKYIKLYKTKGLGPVDVNKKKVMSCYYVKKMTKQVVSEQ